MFVVCNSVKVLYFNEIIKIALSGRVSDVCVRVAFVRSDGGAGGWARGDGARWTGRTGRQVKG